MRLYAFGSASMMSIVGVLALAVGAAQVIGPIGKTANGCTGAGVEAESIETSPLVERSFPLVNRARKGDRLKQRSVAPASTVPWKKRWPIEIAPLRNAPAAREPKDKLQIGCELPFGAYLAADGVKRAPGRCVTGLDRPDRMFG